MLLFSNNSCSKAFCPRRSLNLLSIEGLKVDGFEAELSGVTRAHLESILALISSPLYRSYFSIHASVYCTVVGDFFQDWLSLFHCIVLRSNESEDPQSFLTMSNSALHPFSGSSISLFVPSSLEYCCAFLSLRWPLTHSHPYWYYHCQFQWDCFADHALQKMLLRFVEAVLMFRYFW